MIYSKDRDILVSLVENRYRSLEKRQLYIRYIDHLVAQDLPPILTFRHLADYLAIDSMSLYKMAFATESFYTRFTIPKRNGGLREISAPYDKLDAIQRWIGQRILKNNYNSFLSVVTGYVPDKSILDHVSPHVHSSCLLKLDIKDFFPSISTSFVRNIFVAFGYNNAVSRTLAALLTVNGRLPQGASTSPYISNLRMKKFDSEVLDFCIKNNLIYTRYADDIVISGNEDIQKLSSSIQNFFDANNLALNSSKTRLYKSLSEVRFITGLTLNQGEVRLPKAMRRKIRVQVHLFLRDLSGMIEGVLGKSQKTMGSKCFDNKDFICDPLFAERIIGKLNYWLNIEPNNQYAQTMKALVISRLNTL